MRITGRQLRQIIREELYREAIAAMGGGESSRVAEGVTHQIDSSGKEVPEGKRVRGGFSLKLVVQGLSESELAAMKKKYSQDDANEKFFLALENKSPQRVVFHARGIVGYADGKPVAGSINAGENQGFIPISTGIVEDTPTGDVELGASSDKISSDAFWESEPLILKLNEIATQAKGMVSGEDAFPAALIKLVAGAGSEPTGAEEEEEMTAVKGDLEVGDTYTATPAWVAAVSKTPLQVGSKGDNVRLAQRLLVSALGRFTRSSGSTDLPQALVSEIDRLISNDATSSMDKISAVVVSIKVDGDFGQLTKLATKIYQHLVSLPVDGRIGKNTATKLAEQNMGINEARRIIERWNKLAGLLKD